MTESGRVALGRDLSEEMSGRLFEAAFACFSEKGFERTTMDDVAVRAGVARATLYYYFRGKDDLFIYLLDRGFRMLRRALEDAIAPGGTPRERFDRILDALVDLFAEYRDVGTVVMQELGRIEREWEDAGDVLREQLGATVREVLVEGARDGSMRPADPEVAGPAIFGGVFWCVIHWANGDGAVPVERIKREIKALFRGGLDV